MTKDFIQWDIQVNGHFQQILNFFACNDFLLPLEELNGLALDVYTDDSGLFSVSESKSDMIYSLPVW